MHLIFCWIEYYTRILWGQPAWQICTNLWLSKSRNQSKSKVCSLPCDTVDGTQTTTWYGKYSSIYGFFLHFRWLCGISEASPVLGLVVSSFHAIRRTQNLPEVPHQENPSKHWDQDTMLSCSAILKIAARKINQAGTKNHPWDVCVHCPQERQRLEMVLQ